MSVVHMTFHADRERGGRGKGGKGEEGEERNGREDKRGEES